MLLQAFRNCRDRLLNRVEEIFAVPNYIKFFEDRHCIDKNFANFAKLEHTQLQFIFEKCEVNDYFPLGVRMLYRAYSAESVLEIEPVSNVNFVAEGGFTSSILTGFVPIRTQVIFY
jgi:hypothetical protein